MSVRTWNVNSFVHVSHAARLVHVCKRWLLFRSKWWWSNGRRKAKRRERRKKKGDEQFGVDGSVAIGGRSRRGGGAGGGKSRAGHVDQYRRGWSCLHRWRVAVCSRRGYAPHVPRSSLCTQWAASTQHRVQRLRKQRTLSRTPATRSSLCFQLSSIRARCPRQGFPFALLFVRGRTNMTLDCDPEGISEVLNQFSRKRLARHLTLASPSNRPDTCHRQTIRHSAASLAKQCRRDALVRLVIPVLFTVSESLTEETEKRWKWNRFIQVQCEQ